MLRVRSAPLVLAILPLLAACSDDAGPANVHPGSNGGAGGSGPATLPAESGFTTTIVDDARLVVASADGRTLLDGLAPADETDDLPRAGFAVRDQTTSYEMQYGSFKPTDVSRAPWRHGSRLVATSDGADVLDAAGSTLAHLHLSTPEPSHLAVRIEPGDGPERRFSWGFACGADDQFAGFGAQSLDVDHRGFTVPTWVSEQGVGKAQDDGYDGLWFLVGTRHASQIPIPQFLSSRGFILTAETDLRAVFALCSEHANEARVQLDLPATVHLFDGPTPPEAIARATATFGRPRMPPRIAFSPWLDAIFGSAGVRDIAGRARAAKVPASVIWTEDWRGGHWDGDAYRLKEDWDVDPTLYPDFPQLADDLHGEGYDFYVYFNPFIYEGSNAWKETQPNGWLVKTATGDDYVFPGATFANTGLLDLDDDGARAWAIGKMRGAMAMGADGWMNDFGEWLPTDGVTAKGPSLPRHNPYAAQWQALAREAIDGMGDGRTDRLFFCRSGWFGTPADADVVWAGDQRTDLEADDGMPTVLPIGIGLGLVGFSTFAHDIGGYQSASNAFTTKEVFFRWTELGAWSPVMRTHHGTNPTRYEPGAQVRTWTWWEDAESTEHFRRYAALHMALVPYTEGLAAIAAQRGLPIWRGLMLGFPTDPNVWTILDQVMFGDGLLIAPVMTQGATSRSVYLPAGRWFPWAGGPAIDGGQTITAAAAIGDVPVFAREGAVVPTYPDGVMTLARGSAEVPDASSVGDDRVVYAFLGQSGSFTEAGGLSYQITQTAPATAITSVAIDGVAAPACSDPPVAPCVAATADGTTVYAGADTVTLGTDAGTVTLAATGGDASRHVTWVVRE